MFVNIKSDELPLLAIPEHRMMSIAYLKHFRNANLNEAICGDSVSQVVTGLLHHLPDDNISITLPKGSSFIEVYSTQFVRTLMSICKEFRLLVSQNNVVGLHVEGLTEEANNEYVDLCKHGKICDSVRTVFRSKDMFRYMQINSAEIYEYIGEKFELGGKSIELLLNSKLYLYFALMTSQENKICSIPLLGWSKDDIENNHYLRNLTTVFKKVFFIGTSENGNWLSTHLVVSKPYDDFDTFFCYYQ